MLRGSEWIIVAYAAYLLALVPFRRVPSRRRAAVLLATPLLAATVLLATLLPDTPTGRTIRAWLPLLQMLACYWLTGLYFVDPQTGIESRFAGFDRRVRAWLGLSGLDRSAPRLVLELLEAAYLSCYVMVPAGMLAVVLSASGQAAERYLQVVLLAELGCFGMLPWIRTRPAWVLNPDGPLSKRPVLVRRVSLAVTRHASTRANTFPSGHAAGALATALAVAPHWPLAGAVFFVLALGIVVGSVVGEYHYAGDAIAGVAVGLAAWGVVVLASPLL